MKNLVESDDDVRRIVRAMRTVAVLGIKTEAQAGQPAFDVPQYLVEHGLNVIPVPVYFPDVKEILGKKVVRTVAEIPEEIDVVDVFRRPQDIDQHVDDLIAKRPKVVWFQLGIRNDAAARRLAEAGIEVVQNRCLLVDHARFAA